MRHISRKFKETFYTFYGIAGLSALIFIGFLGCYSGIDTNLLLSATAVVLSVIYFIQKQKLEEDKLFFESFSSFNDRFANLSPLLHKLPKEVSTNEEQFSVIAKYFDLCAEEYYFYRNGRIPADVWICWGKGMLYYINNYPCIFNYWENMEKSKTHYGLSVSVLESAFR